MYFIIWRYLGHNNATKISAGISQEDWAGLVPSVFCCVTLFALVVGTVKPRTKYTSVALPITYLPSPGSERQVIWGHSH